MHNDIRFCKYIGSSCLKVDATIDRGSLTTIKKINGSNCCNVSSGKHYYQEIPINCYRDGNKRYQGTVNPERKQQCWKYYFEIWKISRANCCIDFLKYVYKYFRVNTHVTIIAHIQYNL